METQMETLRADEFLKLWSSCRVIWRGHFLVEILMLAYLELSSGAAQIPKQSLPLSCLEGILLVATSGICFFPSLLTHIQFCDLLLKLHSLGTSLVVQWLRLCALDAGGPGSIPSQGIRYHMPKLRVHMLQLTDPSCHN